MQRRTFLTGALALGACGPLRVLAGETPSRALVFADMHSHIGMYSDKRTVREAMVSNGMLVVARKIVADGAVIRRTPGKGYNQVREPAQGELAQRFEQTLTRMRTEHKAQALVEITDAAALARVLGGTEPAVVIASEGADFLDGDLKRLEAARERGLAHLQLVHYRISEIGDISTDRPVHNGLTAFGKEVVANCNRLGILIDVAHATSDGIAQALEISTKPMIYSHGHMYASPHWTLGQTRARAIATSLARRMAQQGGVIGLWPLASQFRSLDAYAGALLDAASLLGPSHVGIGSDMPLAAGSVMPGYEEFAALEGLLAKRGAKPEDMRNIMGGNYLRVLGQALGS